MGSCADGALWSTLNRDHKTLAYLPDLCDMVDGTLIFDEKMETAEQSDLLVRRIADAGREK